jgi:methyl-accepting chemotaxis protein
MTVRDWYSRARRRYRNRLVAGVLLITLPIMILIVVVLTQTAATRLRTNALQLVQKEAALLAGRVDTYLGERQVDIRLMATAVEQVPLGPAVQPVLSKLLKDDPAMGAIEVLDPAGHQIAISAPADHVAVDYSQESWFKAAASGTDSVSPITKAGDEIHLTVAHTLTTPDGRVAGVIVGYLEAKDLTEPLNNANFARTGELYLATGDKHLILSSANGAVHQDADILRAGGLSTVEDTPAVRSGLTGQSGAVQDQNIEGVDSLAGYAPVKATGWVAVAREDASDALDGANDQRLLGVLLVIGGAILLVIGALIFARRESRHLRTLVGDIRTVGATVTTSAQDLSSASRELAATTSEQSAGVTETSATMDELARTAGTIAATVDRVVGQLNEARNYLQHAQQDITASGERTLALSGRVHDIGAILVLINEIADQTNLLALNAAIEAARAGETGRGFAVVADEVRRLAERSKTSAAEIANIVGAAEAENSSTVLAMEAGAKQVNRSLGLIEEVSVGAEQVRLTTQQQHTATEQVVGAMGQINEGSRQLSETAQQLAESAESLTKLADNLDQTAETTATRL